MGEFIQALKILKKIICRKWEIWKLRFELVEIKQERPFDKERYDKVVKKLQEMKA